MRRCARVRCRANPSSTVALRYSSREVLVEDLHDEWDPNLLDLCSEHIDRLTPPMGWVVIDTRAGAVAGAR